jgi:hypothetical protein
LQLANGLWLLVAGHWLLANERLPALFVGGSIQKAMIISPETKNQKPGARSQQPVTNPKAQKDEHPTKFISILTVL